MITGQDASALARLLAKGFPERGEDYWLRAFETLANRDSPEGYPRFGYMLESDQGPVGVILMIFTRFADAPVRCNISSWYVDERFRGYASLLIAAAVRHKDVTYINISPATHTWPVIEAQGFRCHPTILLDATEKIPGLAGKFLANRGPKYFKGPQRPRLGDLAFCESVLFGP